MEQDWLIWWIPAFTPQHAPPHPLLTTSTRKWESIIVLLTWKGSIISIPDCPSDINGPPLCTMYVSQQPQDRDCIGVRSCNSGQPTHWGLFLLANCILLLSSNTSVNWEYGCLVFVAVTVVVFLMVQIESGSKDLIIQELMDISKFSM